MFVQGGFSNAGQFIRDIATAVVEASQDVATARGPTLSRLSDALREFHRMDPPKFNVEVGPLEANHWLSELKKIFEMLGIVDSRIRISLASFQLVGEADEWWTTWMNGRRDAMRMLGGVYPQGEVDPLEGMSWLEIESSCKKQYFPESFRDKLQGQFE